MTNTDTSASPYNPWADSLGFDQRAYDRAVREHLAKGLAIAEQTQCWWAQFAAALAGLDVPPTPLVPDEDLEHALVAPAHLDPTRLRRRLEQLLSDADAIAAAYGRAAQRRARLLGELTTDTEGAPA